MSIFEISRAENNNKTTDQRRLLRLRRNLKILVDCGELTLLDFFSSLTIFKIEVYNHFHLITMVKKDWNNAHLVPYSTTCLFLFE